ncbi:SIR2 family protein [Rathayibacter rathayi]|uniref:SIR2 family protein n=1 Tax=Rathayibacter rathayi TaxID=33887 RepID=UPI0011B0A22F|nr:SIR2 family protein [Rathayibacter rathayi]
MFEDDKPFFSREKTKQFITEAIQWPKIVIYAGAGVTIDRSGLGWGQLVHGLLANYITSPEQRDRLLRGMAPQEAASVAAQLYLDDHHGDYRDRLTDQLRVLLYNTGQWQKGDLALNIARLALALNRKAIRENRRNSGAVVVTPNYDSYIFEELSQASTEIVIRGRSRLRPRLLFPTNSDPLRAHDLHGDESEFGDIDFSSWLTEGQSAFDARYPSCIHLHGYISRSTTIDGGRGIPPYRHPVVSEQDYFITARSSYSALRALFSDSAVILAGSSMTDPPLLRALAATYDSTAPRWAIVPIGVSESRDDRLFIRRQVEKRFRHFNVTPVFVDLYGQIQQLFDELILASKLEDPDDYPRSDKTYGSRLDQWSQAWRNEIARAPEGSLESQVDVWFILRQLRE